MARLIGTAGHVDHGKTTLIQALTGIDADRLPEEKRRGMTIDVGFAYIDLEGVGRVSIVDVPGHERFLSNMLVGALGTDVALLCVAADEGVMPQTREHLEILELLPVERLVVALTRADLADPDTLALARAEVEETLAASRFGNVPILAVSAFTGSGLPDLRQALATALADPEQPPVGAWYLPIDRAFVAKGHGCVVTGTLAMGRLEAGDRAELVPGSLDVRVRSVQLHGESATFAEKGRRTAVNLGGVALENVHRGMIVASPGVAFESACLDARIQRRRSEGPKVRHGMRVRVAIGADEVVGKLFLNDHEPDVVQLRLERTVACVRGQPLIIRRHSPPDLLAGGRVLVPEAKPRRKGDALNLVQSSADGPGADVLEMVAAATNGLDTKEVCRRLGKTPQALGDVFQNLADSGKLIGFAGLWMTPETYFGAVERFLDSLNRLHTAEPQRPVQPREKVVASAKLPWAGKPLDRLVARMVQDGHIDADGTSVRAKGFLLELSPRQRELLDRVKSVLDEAGINVPFPSEIARALTVPPQAVEEILRLAIDRREVVRIADGVFYTLEKLEWLKREIARLSEGKPFGVAGMRDALGTSRKYVVPLLEHFDSIRFTMRVGENRVVAR